MIDVGAPDFILGVVGSGAMGAGIAQVALSGGMYVVLTDANTAQLEKARSGIFARLDRLVEKGEAKPADVAAAKARLKLADHLQEFESCRIVVEAIYENLDAKRKVFQALEAVVAEDAILASNTSSIPIASIAQACAHRRRVAGMHFFNPVPLMRLVEIIASADTSPDVADALAELGKRMGRTPVKVKDAPGFLVNLGGRAYYQEALHILQENVTTPEDVDLVMRDCCGFRMGPFELLDLTGMDVNYPVSEIVHKGYWYDPRIKTTPLHESMFLAGRFGRKTGTGFHRYDAEGKKLPSAAPSLAAGAEPARVILPEAAEGLVSLAVAAEVDTLAADDGHSPILVAPWGEDCTATATRLGLDPRRTVALDLSHNTSKRITMMMAPGGTPSIGDAVAAMLVKTGRLVTRIKDSPGFIAQRITAMIANLGCEIAQMGLANPADIDKAMQLGLNYPAGPLGLADKMGVKATYEIMCRLQEITGSDRYRPSLWLRRRAMLGISAATPE
ncbi:MAG TPA: 3-hydroxyacyl-CoA dehydrogenase [Stellaceae bacterium]|nr:3-hydroxyacyl-CoA dehydrogenase [Stellaceae bacterium]